MIVKPTEHGSSIADVGPRSTRISIKYLVGLVGVFACFFGAFRARSASGVFSTCVLCLALDQTWRTLRRGCGHERGQWLLPAILGRNLARSILVIGLADLTFLFVYSNYAILRLPSFAHRPSPNCNISVFGMIYGLVLAVVMARFLRLTYWPGKEKARRWEHLGFVIWMFFSIAVLGMFTGIIFKFW